MWARIVFILKITPFFFLDVLRTHSDCDRSISDEQSRKTKQQLGLWRSPKAFAFLAVNTTIGTAILHKVAHQGNQRQFRVELSRFIDREYPRVESTGLAARGRENSTSSSSDKTTWCVSLLPVPELHSQRGHFGRVDVFVGGSSRARRRASPRAEANRNQGFGQRF